MEVEATHAVDSTKEDASPPEAPPVDGEATETAPNPHEREEKIYSVK
eukprot:gene10706-9394_t